MSWVLMELALLAGPLVGLLATRGVAYERRTPLRLLILAGGVVIWVLEELGLRIEPPLQVLPLTVFLFAIWLVVGLSRPDPGSGRARRLFFWIPAGVLVAASVLLGTVGALGVGMAVAPHDQAVHQVFGPTRSAYVTYVGGATLDHRTYRVELRRRLPWVGLLEWTVATRSYTSDALRADQPPSVEILASSGRSSARIGFPGGDAALPGPDTLAW